MGGRGVGGVVVKEGEEVHHEKTTACFKEEQCKGPGSGLVEEAPVQSSVSELEVPKPQQSSKLIPLFFRQSVGNKMS